MEKIYLNANNVAVILNPKSGSETIARAIIKSFHPVISEKIYNPKPSGGLHLPEGKTLGNTRVQWMCPTIEKENASSTIMLVRNPVDRFLSACAEYGIEDINTVLDTLEASFEPEHKAFEKQSDYLESGSIGLYKFPEDLGQLKTDLDFSDDIELVSLPTPVEKQGVSQGQHERIVALYAEDVELYNGITSPGQKNVIAEEIEHVYIPQVVSMVQFRLGLIQIGIMPSDVTTAITSIEDVVEREIALTQWEYKQEVNLGNPLVESIRQVLGKTQEELEQLFILAAAL